MIARKSPRLTAKHQQFAREMLPTITRIARQCFSHLDTEAKEEATAEVVAHAFCMYVGLVEQGKEALAYPSVLAMYGVRRVRIGRQAATPQNVRDISSPFCQIAKGVRVESLDQYDRDAGGWEEVLVEDKRSGPAEIASTRIDFTEWMKTLPERERRIAKTLATGETTSEAAKRFNLSAARISQLRRELKDSWEEFVGDSPAEPFVAVS